MSCRRTGQGGLSAVVTRRTGQDRNGWDGMGWDGMGWDGMEKPLPIAVFLPAALLCAANDSSCNATAAGADRGWDAAMLVTECVLGGCAPFVTGAPFTF